MSHPTFRLVFFFWDGGSIISGNMLVFYGTKWVQPFFILPNSELWSQRDSAFFFHFSLSFSACCCHKPTSGGGELGSGLTVRSPNRYLRVFFSENIGKPAKQDWELDRFCQNKKNSLNFFLKKMNRILSGLSYWTDPTSFRWNWEPINCCAWCVRARMILGSAAWLGMGWWCMRICCVVCCPFSGCVASEGFEFWLGIWDNCVFVLFPSSSSGWQCRFRKGFEFWLGI